jgi:hypothetical protein
VGGFFHVMSVSGLRIDTDGDIPVVVSRGLSKSHAGKAQNIGVRRRFYSWRYEALSTTP